MAAAVEAINGLTSATESANVLAKSAAVVQETIMKSMSTLVNNILQPLFPLFMWLINQLFLGLMKVFDALKEFGKIIIDFVISPIIQWLYDTWLAGGKLFFEFRDKVIAPILQWLYNRWFDGGVLFFEFRDKVIAPIIQWLYDRWFSVGVLFFDFRDSVIAPIINWLYGLWYRVGQLFFEFRDNYVAPVINWLYSLWYRVGVLFFDFRDNYVAPLLNWLYDVWKYGGSLFFSVYSNASNILGFAEGGVVPGAIGAPQLAVVHGGETITPPGKQSQSSGNNITINMYGYQDDKFVQKVKDVLRSQGAVYNL